MPDDPMVEFPPLGPAATEAPAAVPAAAPAAVPAAAPAAAPTADAETQDIDTIKANVLAAIKGIIPEGVNPQVDFKFGGDEDPTVFTVTIPPPKKVGVDGQPLVETASSKVRRMTKDAAKNLSGEYSEEFLRNMDIL